MKKLWNKFINFYTDNDSFYFSNKQVFWFGIISFIAIIIKILQEYNLL